MTGTACIGMIMPVGLSGGCPPCRPREKEQMTDLLLLLLSVGEPSLTMPTQPPYNGITTGTSDKRKPADRSRMPGKTINGACPEWRFL